MPIKLYNTLYRKKQIFNPIKNHEVKIYACGPTVYWFAHIGNLRTYIFEDILRRTFEYNKYKILHVMNITDVEDKIIQKAAEEKKNISKITGNYEKSFFKDIKKLNIKKAKFCPKATKHIKEMILLINKLMKNKIAYKSDDGSIYFNISKFKNYGRLSDIQKQKLKIGARISMDEYQKENAQDFALWKVKKEGEPFWPSPWGDGRPGWHIECSAMSIKYLGAHFDIHAGGIDNVFPHHENEIAQSESATGKKLANFWIHGEHLLIDNQKMAKSLNNFYTLIDIEKKNFNPLAFRYFALTAHYRSKLNFTWDALEAAQNTLNNLYNSYKQIISDKNLTDKNGKNIKKYKEEFINAINDDLNTPKALALVWQIIKDSNISNAAKKILILEFDKILGLGLNKVKPIKIPLKIKKISAQREELRVNQQFIQADLLRKKIERLGYTIEDTPLGPKISNK